LNVSKHFFIILRRTPLKYCQLSLLALVLCLTTLCIVEASDIKETARATALKLQKTTVTLRLVVKIKVNAGGQSRDQEQKIEVAGTVIDPSGLTVVDASSIDPSTRANRMGMKVEIDIKETMILLEDGTEIESDVVLKDTDLGLAFVRPRDTSKQFEAITLKQRDTAPQILDEIFTLGRLGKIGNRTATIAIDSIKAIVKGPRSFYVTDRGSNFGCIAFSANAEPLGVYVIKLSAEEGGGGAGGGAIGIIRPVNDLIEIAELAKKAKVPSKEAPAETKDSKGTQETPESKELKEAKDPKETK
jgi:hypothetical protein